MQAILIPVKPLDQAKGRLAALLAAADRRQLGIAMLTDVLRATDGLARRFIVTSDNDAEELARTHRCELVSDPGGGLNKAIEVATRKISGCGIDTLLVLPGDLPLIDPAEITEIFAESAPIVIVSSGNGGTNALLRRPPEAIRSRYGPESSRLHAEEAQSKGLHAQMVRAPSLLLDVDEPDDLEELARANADRESVRVARALLK